MIEKYLTEDGLNQLTSWSRDGLSREQIATNIGISRSTLYRWTKDHPEIEDALQEGQRPINFETENALLKSALGYYYTEEETIIDKDGRITTKTMKKYAQPNIRAQTFLLKNRKPELWNETIRQEIKAEKEDADDIAEREKEYSKWIDKMYEEEQRKLEEEERIKEENKRLKEQLNKYLEANESLTESPLA